MLPESPVKFFLRNTIRSDINSQKEFSEIHKPILITIKGPEDMFTKFICIPRWEALCVNLQESCWTKLALWTVHQEALVPLLDGVFVIPGVAFQEIHVCL